MTRTLAIDLSVLEAPHPAGVARYARSLASTLSEAMPAWRIIGICQSTKGMEDLANYLDLIAVGPRWPRPLWRRWVLPRAARRYGADILHVPVSHAPRARGIVVTRCVHDVAAAAGQHDGYGGARRAERRRLHHSVPTVFPSAATYAAFRSIAPTFDAPVEVIHHGVETRFFEAPPHTMDLPDAFGLVVGTVRPRRQPTLLSTAASRLPGVSILWAGHGVAPDSTDHLRFIGPVTERELIELYHRARFTVLPSDIEGFGLPLLEAMAAGKPVVAANCAALREIGGGWPIYFESGNERSLYAALTFAAATPDSTVQELSRNHAAHFTWSRCALAHAAFFEDQ